jgi:hypothetical protein
MTDMQLIVPPLEENNRQEDEAASRGMKTDGSPEDGQGSVLPEELRANFEAMKSVWRQARRASGEEEEELRRKERELAIETAVSADAEIAKWQSGIAELEALLAEGGEEDELEESDDEHRHAVVEFPSLLSIVPHEEEDLESPDEHELEPSDGSTKAYHL